MRVRTRRKRRRPSPPVPRRGGEARPAAALLNRKAGEADWRPHGGLSPGTPMEPCWNISEPAQRGSSRAGGPPAALLGLLGPADRAASAAPT